MAITVAGEIRVKLLLKEFLDSAENKSGFERHELTSDSDFEFTDGNGSGQAQLVWSDRQSVTASATNTIDLGTGSSITDTFGGAIVPFGKIKAICVYNRSSTAGDILRVGPAVANGFTGPWVDASDLNTVYPGGLLLLTNDAGWTVTDGSVDTIRIVEAGGANTVSYDVFIVGIS